MGRFPLLTDENVAGPIVEGLRARGWEVLRVVDVIGERSDDSAVFAYAAERGLTLVSTDRDILIEAKRWLLEGRGFRLVCWEQGRFQRLPVGQFVDAFEALASRPEAFAAGIEFLALDR